MQPCAWEKVREPVGFRSPRYLLSASFPTILGLQGLGVPARPGFRGLVNLSFGGGWGGGEPEYSCESSRNVNRGPCSSPEFLDLRADGMVPWCGATEAHTCAFHSCYLPPPFGPHPLWNRACFCSSGHLRGAAFLTFIHWWRDLNNGYPWTTCEPLIFIGLRSCLSLMFPSPISWEIRLCDLMRSGVKRNELHCSGAGWTLLSLCVYWLQLYIPTDSWKPQVVVWPTCGQNSQYSPIFPTGREAGGARLLTQSTQACPLSSLHISYPYAYWIPGLCVQGKLQPRRLSSWS